MARYDREKTRAALDEQALRDLALTYVGRFATSRTKLARYLERKLRERGWDGKESPDIEAIIGYFSELGYVDDAGFARMKGASMERRGLGARRIAAALRADGIGEKDRAEAENSARTGEWDAADIFARRRRIGPYAGEAADLKSREKQIAAFLRAGHRIEVARSWVDAAPGEFPERSE